MEGLNDPDDQVRIYNYLCSYPAYDNTKQSSASLFYHADNIQWLCKELGADVPAWFKEKYGHLLHVER